MDEGVVDAERVVEPIEFGTILANRYTILRPEKGGGFTCRDAQSDALRSVWVFKPQHALDPNGDKFLLELTKAQSLEHPQLRKLLDFGREPNGTLYAVYEPLELRNLSDVIDQDWPLGEERIVWLLCQLLSALEVAHAVGLTHGDLRPENIRVRAAGSISQNEEILLCGLGLARSARYAFSARSSRPQLKLAEWLVGTPHYASPEQLRGELFDARSDVYSAGVLMFQLLTRALPFDAASDHDTAYMQCYTPPPPPSGYSRVSAPLEAVCLKALAKTPDVRYQTANEMRAALLASQVQRGARLSTRPPRKSSSPPPLPARQSVSAPAEIVVATRISEPAAALVRRESITAAPIETPIPPNAPPAARRAPSASLLLSVSALAIAAALILPDLRDRETGGEPVALSDLRDGFAKHPPRSAPISAPAPAPAHSAAAEPDPAPAPPPSAAAAPAAPEPAAPAVQSEATATPPAAAEPAPVAPPVRAPRPRVRAVEKTVVAAEATIETESAEPAAIAMDIATGADAAPAVEPTPIAEPAKVDDPAPAQPMAAETAAKLTLPEERETLDAPVPGPVTPPPPPRPIVLTNVPRSAASQPTSTLAQEVDVVIGEAKTTRGAVSKAGLRGAFNQAALARCYRESINTGEVTGRAMSAQLSIETNLTGRIISAEVEGQGLPSSLVRCLETAARLGRVREADTGALRATVDLRLQVR